jgi:hypothetical protein
MADVKVWCAHCDQPLWINREGETKCDCGVRHTFVAAKKEE